MMFSLVAHILTDLRPSLQNKMLSVVVVRIPVATDVAPAATTVHPESSLASAKAFRKNVDDEGYSW